MVKKYVLVSVYDREIDVTGFENFEQANKEMKERFCDEIKYRTDDYVDELQGLLGNGDVDLRYNCAFIGYDYSKSGCIVDFSINEVL